MRYKNTKMEKENQKERVVENIREKIKRSALDRSVQKRSSTLVVSYRLTE